MATLVLSITLETEAVGDAVRELEAIVSALPRRHGEAFRALDRRIGRFLGDDGGGVDWSTCFAWHTLEPGCEMMVPAGELMAVLKEARQLRVLG